MNSESSPDNAPTTNSEADDPQQTDIDSAEDAAPAGKHGQENKTDAEAPKEIGGRPGPDPVRYGDWEKKGRCIDF